MISHGLQRCALLLAERARSGPRALRCRRESREVPRGAVAPRPHGGGLVWPARFHRAGARGRKGSPPRRGRFAPARGGLGGRRDFIAPARAAEVVSSNIVGYNKVKLQCQMTMTCASFQEVGNAAGTISIQSIVPDTSVTPIDWEDDDLPKGARLLIWNGSSYVGGTYYWTGEVPRDIGAEMEEDLDLPEGFYNNIWVDADYEPVDLMLPAGTAFWIDDANKTATSTGFITVSGEVVGDSANREFSTNNRMTMLGNPLPVEISANDLVMNGVTGIDWNDDDFAKGSRLLVWNGSSYVGGTYYWTGEVPRDIGAEMEEDLDLPAGSYNNIWVDADYEPVDVIVPVGGAFWIDNSNSGDDSSVTFPSL